MHFDLFHTGVEGYIFKIFEIKAFGKLKINKNEALMRTEISRDFSHDFIIISDIIVKISLNPVGVSNLYHRDITTWNVMNQYSNISN